jgi:hypothetical protein
MTSTEIQLRREQYLRWQDLKESQRARKESDLIAKLPLSASQERGLAEAAEVACRDQYERDRADFVGRHAAPRSEVTMPVHPSNAAVSSILYKPVDWWRQTRASQQPGK